MRFLGLGLYEFTRKFSLMGVEIGGRCIAVQGANSQVLLISPIQFTAADVSDINSLGQVQSLIAPNLFHHLFLNQSRVLFPGAQVLAPAGLEEKVKSIKVDQILPDVDLLASYQLESYLLKGMPQFNEVVFYHRPSQTLILTDCLFNLKGVRGFAGNLVTSLMGTRNKVARSRLFNSYIKDTAAFQLSVNPLLNLPKKMMTVAHGEVITQHCDQIFAKMFARP